MSLIDHNQLQQEFMDNLKDATSGTGIVIPLGTPDLTPCF